MGASAVRGLRRTGLFAVIGAASACSFILDFDELEEGQGGAPAKGGAPSSGGQLSAGGNPPITAGDAGQAGAQGGTESAGGSSAAGAGTQNETGGSNAGTGSGEAGAGGQAPQCDPGCVSNDPCVSARCVQTENGAECVRGAETGLVYRSELPSLSAEKFEQLDLVAGEGEFYLSTLSVSGGVRDGAIHRVALETTAKAKLAVQLADIFGAPARSAPVLMPNFADRVIHAIFGVEQQKGAEYADIGSVDFSRDFEPTRHEILGERYRPGALDNGRAQRPTAIHLRNTGLYVAWLDGSSEVKFAQDEALSRDAIPSFYWPDYPISAVKLVSGRYQKELDVVYTVPGLGVYFSEPGQDPRQLKECETRPGELEGLALAPTAADGRWLLSWSKRGANYVSTEAHFVGCAPQCDLIQPTCTQGGRGEHDIALASFTVRENPPLSHVVRVLPIAAAKDAPASLRAQASRLDLPEDQAPTEALLGGEITLAEGAPYRDDRGPDQLAVAVAGREVLVAWAEPAASGPTENLRLKRLTLCSPPPDSP